jgi:hypothetical protein
MFTWRRALGIALFGLVITPAFTARGDESLADKAFWDKQMNYMKDSIASANSKCGTTIAFDWIDKPTLKAKTAANSWSPNGVCSGIFDSIRTTCGTDEGKKRVVQKIKSVSCGFGDPRTLALSGGKATLMTNNREPNFGEWAKAQLGDKL